MGPLSYNRRNVSLPKKARTLTSESPFPSKAEKQRRKMQRRQEKVDEAARRKTQRKSEVHDKMKIDVEKQREEQELERTFKNSVKNARKAEIEAKEKALLEEKRLLLNVNVWGLTAIERHELKKKVDGIQAKIDFLHCDMGTNSRKIFVGKVSISDFPSKITASEKATRADIRMAKVLSIFQRFGSITRFESFWQKEHCFITFDRMEDAEKALETLQSFEKRKAICEQLTIEEEALGRDPKLVPQPNFYVRWPSCTNRPHKSESAMAEEAAARKIITAQRRREEKRQLKEKTKPNRP